MGWTPNIGPIFGGGGGGNAANIGNQAIKAYGNQRTVAPSAGGGIIKTPQKAYSTASAGSLAKPQRDINQPPVNAQYGYTPGGFDDPTIDWQAIYDIFIAGNQGFNQGAQDSGYAPSGSAPHQVAAPQAAPAPAPLFFQSPEQIQAAAQVQPPQVITGSAHGQAGDPTGNAFEAFGTPSSFGGFERQRNQRGPTKNASMTPEMLRRAAAARLG